MYKTKIDLPEKTRRNVIVILNDRLAESIDLQRPPLASQLQLQIRAAPCTDLDEHAGWSARPLQRLACRCASRNHRYLSTSREIPVNRSAVSASPSSSVSVIAARTTLPYTDSCVDR